MMSAATNSTGTAAEPLLGWSDGSPNGSKETRWQKTKRIVTSLPAAAWGSGVFCTNAAMMNNSSLWLITKKLCNLEVSVFQQLFTRGVFGFLALVAISKLMRWTPVFGNPKVMGWIILRTCMVTAGVVCVYSSVSLLPIGDSSALKQLSAVFVAFLGWALGWEPINALIVMGAIACSAGATLISHPPFLFGGHQDWSKERMLGIIISLGAAIFMTLANLVVGKLGKSTSTLSLMVWFDLVGVLTSIVPLFLGFPRPPTFDFDLEVWLLLSAQAVLSLVGQTLLTRGFQLCNATKGTAIQTTIVIYCYVLGYLVLGEPLSYLAAAGTVALIGGVLSVAEGKRRAKLKAVLADAENPLE